MNISISSIISKSDNLLEATMKDSLALMSIEQGSYYGLNPVGKIIWENIDNPVDVKSLVDLLLNKFTIDEDTCKKETLNFLKELEKREMINIK